jgi:type VI secretion system (T6SS) baseplate-like injector VgrG
VMMVCMANEKFFGVYPAIVTHNVDPLGSGRVQVAVPMLGDGINNWARLVGRVGDDDELSPVGADVVVAFEAGELERPYVLGALSPQSPGPGEQVLALRSGHRLVIDEATQEVRLSDSNGTVVVLGAGGTVSITTNAPLDVHAVTVNVHATQVAVDGIISCTTLIASASVVSPLYSPGVGNIM